MPLRLANVQKRRQKLDFVFQTETADDLRVSCMKKSDNRNANSGAQVTESPPFGLGFHLFADTEMFVVFVWSKRQRPPYLKCRWWPSTKPIAMRRRTAFPGVRV